jgi:hypothetical protein
LLLAVFVWPISAVPQAATATPVGRLFGDDVVVQGAVSFESQNGFSTALLANGSDVTVRAGKAQIDLASGGSIAICGPAHFTLLESSGAITLALDYGQVRPQVDANVNITIYTPQIVATPIAISDNPRDLTVGLTQEGAMCTVPARGAVRVEQQFSGQSVLVPQGGEISLSGGQLNTMRSTAGTCNCELLVTHNNAPKQLELSRPVAASTKPRTVPPIQSPRTDEPIYRVYMPPLSFDANDPDMPADPDPAQILMVREAAPLDVPLFEGRVEPTLEAASDYVPSQPAAPAPVEASIAAPPPTVQTVAKPAKVKKPGIFARLFGSWHRSKTPCAGTGCGPANLAF